MGSGDLVPDHDLGLIRTTPSCCGLALAAKGIRFSRNTPRCTLFSTGRVVECIASHMAGLGPRPGLPPASSGAAEGAGAAAAPAATAAAASAAAAAASAGACAACGGGCGAREDAVPWAPHAKPRCKAFVDRWGPWALRAPPFSPPE